MASVAYLSGLVLGIFFDELLSRVAVGRVEGLSIAQSGGGGGGEGAGGRGRGRGGLGLQAVEGVPPRGQQHPNPGQEPAPKLVLVKKNVQTMWCCNFLATTGIQFIKQPDTS